MALPCFNHAGNAVFAGRDLARNAPVRIASANYWPKFSHWSEKHLPRYVAEFAGRKSVREHDALDQMAYLAASLSGK